MASKYNNLNELRRKKALLKQEVSELESLIKFDNKKESLSALTNGFTDQFLKESKDEDGQPKVEIRKDAIVRQLSSSVKDKVISKNVAYGIADTAMKGGVFKDILHLGAVALIGNFAQKKAKSKNWKTKLLGMALVYLAPKIIKMIGDRLEKYQKNKSISSMEKLI